MEGSSITARRKAFMGGSVPPLAFANSGILKIERWFYYDY